MFAFELKEKFPSFWLLQIIGWLFYWLMVCITLLSVLPADASILELFQSKLVRAALGLLLTSIMRLVYKRFVRPQNFNAAAWVSIICSVVFGLLWAYLLNVFYWLTYPNFNFSTSYAKLPENVLNYSIILLAWSGLYFGIKFWREWQVERENAMQSAALAQKAQLDMLRYQLNPHFLFNALNSIRASVDEDKNRAKQMITQLAEFLRYSLLNESAKKIPLRDELEAVRNYLAIEKIRFETKLEVDLDIQPEAEDFEVPCFLLNPLVENAIKHGLQNGPEPLKIRITAKLRDERFSLEVANSGKLQNDLNSNGTKIGLKNVKQRLDALFPKTSSFELSEKDGFVFAKIEIGK